MPARLSNEVLRIPADTILATVAGGLVLLVFYPLTLCATGVKNLVRMVRPHSTQTRPQSIPQH